MFRRWCHLLGLGCQDLFEGPQRGQFDLEELVAHGPVGPLAEAGWYTACGSWCREAGTVSSRGHDKHSVESVEGGLASSW